MVDSAQIAAPEGQTNGARSGMSRDALLAGLEAIPDTATLADFAKPAAKVAEPAKEADAPVEAAADEETEADETEVEAADVEVEAKPDSETSKRIAQVQKAERRAKESIALERAEFARERSEHETSKRTFEAKERQFADLAKRAKSDPASVLKQLGLTEDDFDDAAKIIYAQSTAAAADPQRKAQTAELIRKRASEARLEKLEAELAETKKSLSQRDQDAAAAHDAEKYLDSVTKVVSDGSPLLKSALAKSPTKARARLGRIAYSLLQANDEVPDAEDVIAEYEKQRRDELDELGIDPATLSKAAVDANGNAKKPSKTLGSISGKTVAKTKLTAAERDAELLRKLESDDLT